MTRGTKNPTLSGIIYGMCNNLVAKKGVERNFGNEIYSAKSVDMYIYMNKLITGCTINGTSPAEYFNPLSINTKFHENVIFITYKLYI